MHYIVLHATYSQGRVSKVFNVHANLSNRCENTVILWLDQSFVTSCSNFMSKNINNVLEHLVGNLKKNVDHIKRQEHQDSLRVYLFHNVYLLCSGHSYFITCTYLLVKLKTCGTTVNVSRPGNILMRTNWWKCDYYYYY